MQRKRPLIVQKYGGSSLATPDHVLRVARHIMNRKDQNCDLLIVASAMGKTTDNLVKLGHEMNPNPDPREMDMLLSTGEQISISALALAINASGRHQAISFTGPQIGLITDDNYTKAHILEIKKYRIKEALDEDKIIIVAGFQGLSTRGEITTLGRGGSDTTAVALAAALDADYCEIMSDIDGIYTADPKKVLNAKRIDRMHYDQALEMAGAGAKMLHKHSVEFARRHKISLSLGSSLSGQIGTIVSEDSLQKGAVIGVASDDDISVIRFAMNQAEALRLPVTFSKQHIHLKIWQCVQGLGMLGVAKGDRNLAVRVLKEHTTNVHVEDHWGILSIIGEGIGVGTSAANRFFDILHSLNIDIQSIISGELFLKVLCPSARLKIAIEKVHHILVESETNQ